MTMRTLAFRALCAAVLTISMTGAALCAPVAVSDDIEERPFDVGKREARLGSNTCKAVEEHFRVVNDPGLQSRVDMILSRLRPFMKRHLDYKIKIIESDMINAFAVAGGTMYVSTGMLDFVKSDLELAGVIGHEMTHADRNHVVKQMERNDKMTLLAIATAIASGGRAPAMLMSNAIQAWIMGEYSIEMEKEADAGGIDALHAAGYDPVGTITLQERLLVEALKRPQVDMGVYSTHPETRERIAAAEKYMISHGTQPHRKYALGLLRVKAVDTADRASVELDGITILDLPGTEGNRALTRRAASEIDASLQLETAPFDIRVEGDGPRSALFVGPRRILRTSELSAEADLNEIRSKIIQIHADARKAHPMADYFKNY